MKKYLYFLTFLSIVSCSTSKVVDTKNSLYQLLISSENGGASFEFFEIISEPKEFKMLLGDDEIKKLVKPNDILTSNFVLINLGEKNSGGYGIENVIVIEEPTKIIVTIIKKEPKPFDIVTLGITQPYAVLKINSKKPIELK